MTEGRSVLAEAEEIIHGERREDYGGPSESLGRIAGMWSAYLGIDVSPEDVAMLMVLLKVSRAKQGFQRDSLVDIAGYAGCVELLQRENSPPEAQATEVQDIEARLMFDLDGRRVPGASL